ncbi:cytochrome c biogenesis CcdA family protein [Planococcus sp. CP5-4]|uniref:cytochrome c biogenesis CcdA family protein n=1 Tax=unclassified Planococcus (in: firmicutes) TaxID=2662419 RepID=UPI001C2401AD|nr:MULTISPECIES: cytochrome c biogenesis CcdA family protein [unclassified Planococcus (in: firmicutes)]MBU9675028.1 cytochrome c biogenesis CcdA family protein [Planococcus sp. CP5-4_YE]MBV0910378.1 cytochrome c biogenesis CcdA family protein [Planococcus sp. CP5-4_UN]MBW6063846.1 cytochrome c biogenesis CcdA family protein [Planococcus sp. CP5-4]
MENVTILIALAGGFLAFISPCCLPLYPSFISYITGVSVSELKENKDVSFKKKVLMHSVFFSLGFSVIYYILGFSLSTIGGLFTTNQKLIQMLGGIFLVFMGLFLIGIIKPEFMFKEKRLSYKKKSATYLNSFVVGFVFSAGWTPCIGPIFGAIITYGSLVNPAQTIAVVTAYSLGFCIPFIIMAFFIGKTKFILKYSAGLMKVGGIIIVLLGVMIYFDKMYYLNIWTADLQYFIESWLT